MEFKNNFSWSKSRDRTFKECRRKYYFNHYGFWNGWINSEDDRIKRIYYLKQLSTKEIWLGSIIHKTIEYILKNLRNKKIITLSHAIAIIEKRIQSDFGISKIKTYTGYKSKAHKFFEDEYDIEISKEEEKELGKKAKRCIKNFFNSDIFMQIRKTPIKNWITLEDFLSFDFQETQIYLSIDFAIKINDKIIIYDWKTGEERKMENEIQLTLYALYIAEKLKIPPSKIETKLFYLSLNQVDTFKINEAKIEEIKEYIKNSILEMKNLLKNIENNEANEKDFEKNEGYWCKRCSFKKICLNNWGK